MSTNPQPPDRVFKPPPSYKIWKNHYLIYLKECSRIVQRNLAQTGVDFSGESFDELFWQHLYENSSKYLSKWCIQVSDK